MDNKTNNIDTLPHALIGEIASYLNQIDYARFNHCSKSISSSCTSPNTLQCIDLLGVYMMKRLNVDYSDVNLINYPLIKSLFIDNNKFSELVLPGNQQSILHQLKHMVLALDNNSDITAFMTQKCINLSKVTTLKLLFWDKGDVFDGEKFWMLLSKFPAIKHLDVNHLPISDEMIPDQDIKALMPNLKSLKWYYSSPMVLNKLMTIFANNLESLHLFNDVFEIGTDIKFPKLSELKMKGSQQIEEITNKAPNLKSFEVLWTPLGVPSLCKLIEDHQRLQYIKISILGNPNRCYKPIFNDIANLFQIKLQKRDIIHIVVDFMRYCNGDMLLHIGLLKHLASNSKQYTLKFPV